MKELVNDFIAEQALVDTLVADLSEEEWLLPMPGCQMWNIKDAIIHIAFFDYAANKLMRGEAEDLKQLSDAEAKNDEYVRSTAFRGMSGAEVLAWWRRERSILTAAFLNIDPKARIPWAPGFPMSAKSLCSARAMELWAHSVDIYDTLGKDIPVHDRISGTLFLSWQSRPFAYKINGQSLSDVPIYLELTLPSGKKWIKGEENSENYIKGSAKDWALVAIRRRNYLDTELEVHGEEARRYAAIVQTYAGKADPAPAARASR